MSYFEDFEEYRIGSLENELNILKLQAIKELLDKQNSDITNLAKIGDSYENGYSDAIYKMYSEINKIINK